MKRVFVAAALLLLVAALNVTALRWQESHTARLYAACDEALSLSLDGQSGACKEAAEALIPLFEEEMRAFPLFLSHTHVESVMQDVRALPLLAESSDHAHFRAALMHIRSELQTMLEGERVTAENIL